MGDLIKLSFIFLFLFRIDLYAKNLPNSLSLSLEGDGLVLAKLNFLEPPQIFELRNHASMFGRLSPKLHLGEHAYLKLETVYQNHEMSYARYPEYLIQPSIGFPFFNIGKSTTVNVFAGVPEELTIGKGLTYQNIHPSGVEISLRLNDDEFSAAIWQLNWEGYLNKWEKERKKQILFVVKHRYLDSSLGAGIIHHLVGKENYVWVDGAIKTQAGKFLGELSVKPSFDHGIRSGIKIGYSNNWELGRIKFQSDNQILFYQNGFMPLHRRNFDLDNANGMIPNINYQHSLENYSRRMNDWSQFQYLRDDAIIFWNLERLEFNLVQGLKIFSEVEFVNIVSNQNSYNLYGLESEHDIYQLDPFVAFWKSGIEYSIRKKVTLAAFVTNKMLGLPEYFFNDPANWPLNARSPYSFYAIDDFFLELSLVWAFSNE